MSSAGNGTKASRRGLPLHTQMLIGFIVGALAGLACYAFAQDAGWLQTLIGYVTQPVGDLFLRLLFMLVVPLVFSALVLGVVEIGDPRSLGRVGLKTLLWILGVTAIAVTIGLILVNVFQPGQGVPLIKAFINLMCGASQTDVLAHIDRDDLPETVMERVRAIGIRESFLSGAMLVLNGVRRTPSQTRKGA